MTTVVQARTYDTELGGEIVSTLSEMIAAGEMQWTRHQVLNSDEAARAVITRLPDKFRNIDCNHFRRVADVLEKKGIKNGGFPLFTNRKGGSTEESLAAKVDAWSAARTHENHSPEYEKRMADLEWKASVKRARDFQCAACGGIYLGPDLEVHHYTYDRLGAERPDDVCCVCSPLTGRRCHALLDLARISAKNPVIADDALFG